MNLSEKFKSIGEALKRVEVRKGGRTTDVPSSNKFGLGKDTVIGWFSTKYNPASGWSIHKLGKGDEEFKGEGVYRTLQDEKMATSIIKFDFNKGTYAFLDNKEYEEGNIKFEKMSPYTKVIVDSDKILKEL